MADFANKGDIFWLWIGFSLFGKLYSTIGGPEKSLRELSIFEKNYVKKRVYKKNLIQTIKTFGGRGAPLNERKLWEVVE